MSDTNQTATAAQNAEFKMPDGVTNTLAKAYHKATTVYDHIMDPIHEINEYVDAKNDLDTALTNKTISEQEHNKKVMDLQTKYFGEDTARISIANKFEALQDWQDAHGITEIRESVSGVVASIKDAFAKTSAGHKFEEIKLAASKMADEEKTGEHAETSALSSDAFMNGDDLPENMPENLKNQVVKSRNANRGAEADSYLGTGDMDEEISASADSFEK